MVQIKEMKDAAMVAVDPYVVDTLLKDTMSDVDGRAQQQAVELQAKPFISLLNLIGEIYQVRTPIMHIWFGRFVILAYFSLTSNYSVLSRSLPLEVVGWSKLRFSLVLWSSQVLFAS